MDLLRGVNDSDSNVLSRGDWYDDWVIDGFLCHKKVDQSANSRIVKWNANSVGNDGGKHDVHVSGWIDVRTRWKWNCTVSSLVDEVRNEHLISFGANIIIVSVSCVLVFRCVLSVDSSYLNDHTSCNRNQEKDHRRISHKSLPRTWLPFQLLQSTDRFDVSLLSSNSRGGSYNRTDEVSLSLSLYLLGKRILGINRSIHNEWCSESFSLRMRVNESGKLIASCHRFRVSEALQLVGTCSESASNKFQSHRRYQEGRSSRADFRPPSVVLKWMELHLRLVDR